MVHRGPGRPPMYPWTTWFNGEEHTLVRGEDFQVATEAFRNMVLTRARARGIAVSTHVELPDRVIIKAETEDGRDRPAGS